MQQSEAETACLPKSEETVRDDDDEEFQFSNLMDRLGAKKVLEEWVFPAIVLDYTIFYDSTLWFDFNGTQEEWWEIRPFINMVTL